MSEIKHEWGRSVPADVRTKIVSTWGARAIYTGRDIDLLPDRSSWHIPGDQSIERNESRDAVEQLALWINSKGLPFLREQAKSLYPDDSRVVSMDDGPFHIEASPQSSHGYLYIRAWKLKPETNCGTSFSTF